MYWYAWINQCWYITVKLVVRKNIIGSSSLDKNIEEWTDWYGLQPRIDAVTDHIPYWWTVLPADRSQPSVIFRQNETTLSHIWEENSSSIVSTKVYQFVSIGRKYWFYRPNSCTVFNSILPPTATSINFQLANICNVLRNLPSYEFCFMK